MSDVAIRLAGVGKMYKIFSSRGANLKDALGLPSVRHGRYTEFWALRGIDFELREGDRLGIIGRNGAGKSTILKLITQNIAPTEGVVEVKGQVQALLEAGGGLHPEFTGEENINAALTFLGLSTMEIRLARDDIAEFTELGRFLSQPFKTYSLGMQARLAFAIATTIRPRILIIDEVLGAGDAYFFAKSSARMRELLESGAAVILVSHALDQIVRFCDETIWVDRGRTVMRGPSIEVVKAYEKFIRELDDRRIRAKNEKTQLQIFDGFERDSYTDHFSVQINAPVEGVDVSDVVLLRDGEPDEHIRVGDAQDASPAQAAFVQAEGGGWSDPREDNGKFHRTVAPAEDASSATGGLVFYAWFIYPGSEYAVDIRYRTSAEGATVAFGQSGRIDVTSTLPRSEAWRTHRIELVRSEELPSDGEVSAAMDNQTRRPRTSTSRWEGVGKLAMEDVALLDERGRDQVIFQVGRPMTIAVSIVALEAGIYPLMPATLIFRLDGIVVARHVAERQVLELEQDERISARLDLGELQLGNGTYVLSVGLYRKLDMQDIEPSEFYDYFDKSFEFQVIGSPPLHNELVRHPGTWVLTPDTTRARIATARPEIVSP